MTRVYLALGSNLGDRLDNLARAAAALSGVMRVDKVSPVYETAPVHVTDQPRFLNAALAGETQLAPRALLDAVKGIERALGRAEGPRFGPRTIDIDILLYGDTQLAEADLVIPHPRMEDRAFVLVPLADIAPEAVDPASGMTVAALRDALPPDPTMRRVAGTVPKPRPIRSAPSG